MYNNKSNNFQNFNWAHNRSVANVEPKFYIKHSSRTTGKTSVYDMNSYTIAPDTDKNILMAQVEVEALKLKNGTKILATSIPKDYKMVIIMFSVSHGFSIIPYNVNNTNIKNKSDIALAFLELVEQNKEKYYYTIQFYVKLSCCPYNVKYKNSDDKIMLVKNENIGYNVKFIDFIGKDGNTIDYTNNKNYTMTQMYFDVLDALADKINIMNYGKKMQKLHNHAYGVRYRFRNKNKANRVSPNIVTANLQKAV